MSGAEIAERRRDVGRMVRGGDLGRAADLAPEARKRLVDGGVMDVGGAKSRHRERLADGRRENRRDGRLAYEPLFIGVGLGMLARRVDVHEIVGKARPADKTGGAFLCDQRRSAPIALRQVQRRACATGPPFAGRDEGGPRRKQGVEQRRDGAAPRARDVPGPCFRWHRQRVHDQRRVKPLIEGGGRGREHHRVGRLGHDPRRLDGEGQRILVPSGDGAPSATAATEPGKFQRFRGGIPVEPQERRVGADAGDRAPADCFRRCLQAFAPVLTDRP